MNQQESILIVHSLLLTEKEINLFLLISSPNDVHDPHLPDSRVLEEFVSLTNNPWEQKFFAVLRDLDNQIGRLINSLDKEVF